MYHRIYIIQIYFCQSKNIILLCKYFLIANIIMESICKLKNIYKSLYTFEKEFSEKNNITINEGMVLCCMKDEKPRTANEICEFVGLSNSRVSRIINAVETKGYILRKMGSIDKRQMIFTLTEEGKKKIKEMMKHEINLSALIKELVEISE